MKSFLILALTAMCLTVNASETTGTVTLADTESPLSVSSPKLKIDRNNLGRAWVTVEVFYDDLEEYYVETTSVKVPGLRHDLETNKVMLNDTVCANVTKRMRDRLFRDPIEVIKIKETGLCHFDSEVEKKEIVIDTGFDLVTRDQYVLKINAQF